MKLLERFREVQLATNGDYLTEPNKTAILNACSFLSLSLHEWLFPKKTGWLGFLYDCAGAGIVTQVSVVDSLVREKNKKDWKREWLKHVDRVRIYETHSKNGFGSMRGKESCEACSKPFEEMVVYWDGKVGLCNHDWNNSTSLGDLNVTPLPEVWTSSNYQSVRAFHAMKQRRMVEACRDCSFQSNKLYGELAKHGKPIN
jgi:radical SAM protein with 4Fe4S-binding SPASM domain